MNTEDGRLDQIDHAIVAELSRDGRLPVTTLAQRVGLSKTPCQNRLKKLIDDGVIVGFCAVVSPEKLRLEHVAFVEIKLSDTRESALAAFNAAAVVVPEVEQCHLIAGNFDYLLKVRTRDIQEYRAVLGEKISALPHVASTSTHVSMQAVKDKAF
ncbi:MAG: Lrp/AsnC family transcriptional regulator [Pseudomonadota bacterium]